MPTASVSSPMMFRDMIRISVCGIDKKGRPFDNGRLSGFKTDKSLHTCG